jgi:xanthine dehydrogenase YagR molybdenum-binding subunit
MDELAEKLGIDPIELRLRNEPAEDPEKHIPFSSRHLVDCLKTGADKFGWSRRNKPGATRDGQWLVGMGVAAAIRGNPLQASQAMVRLDPDGSLTVRTAMTDIGTGSYTILTQLAASLMGLPPEKVRMELGDSDYPKAAGSGGSFGAASSGSSVYDACAKLRDQVARAAGIDPARAVLKDGQVSAGGQSRALAGLAPAGGIVAQGEIEPGDNLKKYSQQSYGAQFAEVGVDADTGEVRLRRMLGVFTAGRILNEKTARSQALGGMIFGVGAALTEDMVMDLRSGHVVNNNLAEYHVPVHADVPVIDAVFLPELDPDSNPLKAKGIGELGICGAGAAVANAVYNATGVRIRDYPLTLDKVLAGMERRT